MKEEYKKEIRMPDKEESAPGDLFIDAKGVLYDKTKENEYMIAYDNQKEFAMRTEKKLSTAETRIRASESFVDSESSFFEEEEKFSRRGIEQEIAKLKEERDMLKDMHEELLEEKSFLVNYSESFVREYSEDITDKLLRIDEVLKTIDDLERKFEEEKTKVIIGSKNQ